MNDSLIRLMILVSKLNLSYGLDSFKDDGMHGVFE